MPWVWRRSRCAISHAPTIPTMRTTTAATTMSVNSSTSRSSSWVRVIPTATSATTGAPVLVSEAELGPKTGTIARIDGPSVPTYSSV